MWESILFSRHTHTHTQRKTSSLLLHTHRAKKNMLLSLNTHTHTHCLTTCPVSSHTPHRTQHTHIKSFPLKTHTNTDKKESECKRTWPEALFLSLDTLTLYLCLSDSIMSLSLSDCCLHRAHHRKTQLGFCSSPYHFTFCPPVCLSVLSLPRCRDDTLL